MDDVSGEGVITLSSEGSAFDRTLLYMTAYEVARFGPENEKEIAKHKEFEKYNYLKPEDSYNFLKPEDSYHAHYQHKKAEFKNLLQSKVPGVGWNIMNLPPEVVIAGDMAAQDVARIGAVVEEELLADLKDKIHDWDFLKPDATFHAYYQYRLAEHRAQLQAENLSRLALSTDGTQIPGVAPAAAPSSP